MNPEMRIIFFAGGLFVFSFLEFFFEYRERTHSRKVRWLSNFSLIFLGSICVKVLLPSGLAIISLYAKENSFGLFNVIDLNHGVALVLSVILLDFLIYFQHVLSHKVNFLWRFHRVHHADVDLDTTSALRFHPLEILFSIGYKALLVILFGFSVEAIFLFEIILNFMAMFNHSNIGLPRSIEKALRLLIVTPQMHIVHHSVHQKESDTNYGFNFSIWDRLFRTYKYELDDKSLVGQRYYRSAKEHKLVALLTLPFKKV